MSAMTATPVETVNPPDAPWERPRLPEHTAVPRAEAVGPLPAQIHAAAMHPVETAALLEFGVESGTATAFLRVVRLLPEAVIGAVPPRVALRLRFLGCSRRRQ